MTSDNVIMDQKSRPSINVDTLLQGLGLVQEQVRFADSKAALIAAFHVAIFGFMATQVDAIRGVAEADRTFGFWCRVIMAFAYGSSALVAFLFAVRCVWPRMGEDAPQCLLHSTHVASHYKRDYQKYCDDLAKMDARTWGDQVATQIVENSNIVVEKYRLVGKAAKWTVIAVFLWAVMLVISTIGRGKLTVPTGAVTPPPIVHA